MEEVEITYLEEKEDKKIEEMLKNVANACLREEGLTNKNIYISITLTNQEIIRGINKEHRNIDKSTDVLSFPMFEKEEITELKKSKRIEPEPLGDIIISIVQVKKQAEEYGHSFERELAYMVVHGFYHLMGHDHMAQKEKLQMREKEEKLLQKIGIERN